MTSSNIVSSTAGEAVAQTRRLTDDARAQLRSAASGTRSEVRRIAEERTAQASRGLQSLASQATALAEGRTDESGPIGELVERLGQQTDDVARRLDEDGIRGVLDEMTSFGRRHPMAFLGAALVAGVLAGRALRTEAASASEESTSMEGGRPDVPTETELVGV